MKIRCLSAAMLAVGFLALAGCMQMHSATVINKDGSGTATMTMSMSPAVAEAMKDMGGMNKGSGQDMPDFSDINKKQLEKAAKGHGVKITKFSSAEKDGRQGIELEMTFKDLEGLSYVMNQVMGSSDKNEGMGIFDAGDGNLVLKSTTYDFPAGEGDQEEANAEEDSSTEAAEMDPAMAQKSMAAMGKLMGAMSELDIRMEITVPGKIVKSNSPTTEGRTAIWTVNAGNMMTAGQDMEPEIVFSGKGLKIKPLPNK